MRKGNSQLPCLAAFICPIDDCVQFLLVDFRFAKFAGKGERRKVQLTPVHCLIYFKSYGSRSRRAFAVKVELPINNIDSSELTIVSVSVY